MKATRKGPPSVPNDKVIAGFARRYCGCFTLFELFRRKLEMHQGHLVKAAVRLAKTGVPIACCANLKHCWRSRMKLHRLSSPVTVTWCNQKTILLLSAPAAPRQAAARAVKNTELAPVKLLKGVGYCRRHLHLYQPFPHHRRIKLQSVRISHVWK